jgi:hypothetical protein
MTCGVIIIRTIDRRQRVQDEQHHPTNDRQDDTREAGTRGDGVTQNDQDEADKQSDPSKSDQHSEHHL